jgi:hypothetical protein
MGSETGLLPTGRRSQHETMSNVSKDVHGGDAGTMPTSTLARSPARLALPLAGPAVLAGTGVLLLAASPSFLFLAGSYALLYRRP